LRSRVKERRSRDSGNTVLSKEFPGGVLILTGANSAVGLRSMPARYLFLDEVDGDTIEHRAARAVDPQSQLGDVPERLQLVEKCLGRYAEGSDLVVDHDLGALRLGATLIPATRHAACSSL